MKLLVLNGPNLNLVGAREPDIYGTISMSVIIDSLKDFCNAKGCEMSYIQSNHEGALIDAIQHGIGVYDGLILNAGALSHYSYALRDAVACCNMPTVNVHISDITSRESFRAIDVIADVCVFSVIGMGANGYKAAADFLFDLLGYN